MAEEAKTQEAIEEEVNLLSFALIADAGEAAFHAYVEAQA